MVSCSRPGNPKNLMQCCDKTSGRMSFNLRWNLPRGCDLAALYARVLLVNVPPFESEGAGNAGRSMRPQPRMQNKKHTS
jgi:hypothetical protein